MLYHLSKSGALVMMFLVALLFAYPGLRNLFAEEEHDSFPVSTFGMFSLKRPEVHSIPYMRGVTKSGKTQIIRSGHIAPGGMNQTLHRLSRLQRGPRKRLSEECERVAKNIAGRSRYAEVRYLEIVRGYYRPEVLFGERNETPESQRVYARCKVKREKSRVKK
jgi:hypothetical protein